MKEFWAQHRYIFLYILLLISILLIFNMVVNLNTSDARTYFNKQIFNLSFIKNRYETWSSRLVIEYFVIFFCHNHLIFRIANLIIIVSIFSSIIYLLDIKTRYSICIVMICLFCYNFRYMTSAGFIPTCLNYLWPLASMLGMLTFFKMYVKNNKILFYYLCFPIGIIAANAEQFCLTLTIIFLVYSLYSYKKNRKISNGLLFILIFLFLAMIFIVTCPGNHARYALEITKHYPTWNQINFFEKTYDGIVFIFKRYFFIYNAIIPLFSIVIICALFKQHKLKKYMLIPIVCEALLPLMKISSNIIVCSLSLGIVSILLISIREINMKNIDKISIYGILIIGFISRMILTYSPTVYASQIRTFIIMDFSLIVVSILFLKNVIGFKSSFCVLSIVVLSFLQQLDLLVYATYFIHDLMI